VVEDFNYWTEAREKAGAVEGGRPAETATSEPPTSSAPSSSSSGDVDVDVDHDDHESRFCRRHWWSKCTPGTTWCRLWASSGSGR
jgi:hypothetical protein